jgi:hypothetical protein
LLLGIFSPFPAASSPFQTRRPNREELLSAAFAEEDRSRRRIFSYAAGATALTTALIKSIVPPSRAFRMSPTRVFESGVQQSGAKPRGRGRGRRGGPRGTSVPRAPSAARVILEAHEPKNLDLTGSGGLSTTTGQLTLLNPIIQGTTGNNRSGREIKLDHLRLNMTFTIAGQNDIDIVRYIVFLDKESRGTAPAVGDVVQNATFGIGAILSSHNFDNVPSRFKILADEIVILKPTVSVNSTNTVWQNDIKHRLLHIPLKSLTHYYNASNAGTIADIDSNALYLVTWGQDATNPVIFAYDSRVVFRDL